jgi:hypothetical protein
MTASMDVMSWSNLSNSARARVRVSLAPSSIVHRPSSSPFYVPCVPWLSKMQYIPSTVVSS